MYIVYSGYTGPLLLPHTLATLAFTYISGWWPATQTHHPWIHLWPNSIGKERAVGPPSLFWKYVPGMHDPELVQEWPLSRTQKNAYTGIVENKKGLLGFGFDNIGMHGQYIGMHGQEWPSGGWTWSSSYDQSRRYEKGTSHMTCSISSSTYVWPGWQLCMTKVAG